MESCLFTVLAHYDALKRTVSQRSLISKPAGRQLCLLESQYHVVHHGDISHQAHDGLSGLKAIGNVQMPNEDGFQVLCITVSLSLESRGGGFVYARVRCIKR